MPRQSRYQAGPRGNTSGLERSVTSRPSFNTGTERDLWTVTEAASFLGFSEKQVRRYIASGALPAYRLGRAIRIRPVHVESLLRPVQAGGADIDEFITEATS
jgi:excisionase family DNA binding protein